MFHNKVISIEFMIPMRYIVLCYALDPHYGRVVEAVISTIAHLKPQPGRTLCLVVADVPSVHRPPYRDREAYSS